MATTKKNISTEKDQTQTDLQNLFAPCKIKANQSSKADYDYIIEIINPLTNRDKRLITGKKFSVVFRKSASDNFTIETEKLLKEGKSIIPTMLLKGELAGKYSYVWIDETLLSKVRTECGPNVIASKTINLSKDKFKSLTKSEVAKIESYLISSSPYNAAQLAIPQGTFFEIRSNLKQLISDFLEYLKRNQLSYENTRFTEILDKTENSIYTISIVGPSRTGKSTLINALIREKEEISPVNILPTTGVPFTIQPGKTKEAEVIFHDNTVKKGAANVNFLEQFIDQKYNPRNNKSVKLVTVYLENNNLEKGLAYCDVPGLDDVSEEIRRISKIAVYNSSAIIYLIDVAPYKFGSFSINSHHLSDLRDLAPRMDRVYLVFNKVDVLTPDEFKSLKIYINNVIEENDLSKFLPNEPIYISAKQSFEDFKKGAKKKSVFDISDLEKTLWDTLLKTNKNGLHNLGGLIYEFGDELSKYSNIQNSKIIEAEQVAQLKKELTKVKQQLSRLSQIGENDRDTLLSWLHTYINDSAVESINNLDNELKRVPVDAALPNSYAIQQYLENNAYSILNQVFDSVNYRLDDLYYKLNSWVQDELSQVQFFEDGNRVATRDKNNINNIMRPIRDSFSQNIPNAVSVLDKIFNFLGDTVGGFFNWLEILFIGKAKVREKQVTQIVEKARNTYFNIFNTTDSELSAFIRTQYNHMINQLRDRTQIYIGEINKQLTKQNTDTNKIFKPQILQCLQEIEEYKNKLERIKNHLSKYVNINR